MNLEIPPEPTSIKASIKRGLETRRKLEIMSLKQGTWIASPLWSDVGWGKELKKHGLTWQRFMVVVRDHFPYFLDWVKDRVGWDEVMRKLVEHLEDEVAAYRKEEGVDQW
jgi:hypothetical protein